MLLSSNVIYLSNLSNTFPEQTFRFESILTTVQTVYSEKWNREQQDSRREQRNKDPAGLPNSRSLCFNQLESFVATSFYKFPVNEKLKSKAQSSF